MQWLNRLADKFRQARRWPSLDLSPVTEPVSVLRRRVSSSPAWKLVRPALLVILALVAIRFRPAAPAVAMPDDLARLNLVAGQEVILWYAMSDTAGHTLIHLADEFNATNPWGITVTPQNQGGYARLRRRLDEAVARGATPDLVALYAYHAAAYAARNHVAALEAYVDHPRFGLTQADRDDFIPGLLEGERNPRLAGRLWSLPVGPEVMMLVYNLDWLRSLGYQDPPLTWGTFKEICKQAVADPSGDGAPDTFGYAFVADVPTFSAFVLTRGGQLLSDDGRRVLFNTLEGEKAMRIVRDTFSSKCAYAVPGRDWDRSDFANAKVIFNIVPSSALPAYASIIEQSSAFRWGVAPLPYTSPKPVTPLHGQSWTILKTGPERQLAAWLFVRWLAETPQTQRWALANYTLPLRLSAIQAMQDMPDLDPNLKRVLEMAPHGQPEPVLAEWEAIGAIALEAMRNVAGGLDPKDAIAQAERAANAVLQGGAP